MKNLLFVLFLGCSFPFYAQNADADNAKFNLDEVKGTWVIDLKPSPDSPSFLKEFVIDSFEENEFGGKFYETKFSDGFFNQNWDVLYFAFSTKDYSSEYFHSGYFKDGIVYGITYCPNRKFTSHWKGKKN